MAANTMGAKSRIFIKNWIFGSFQFLGIQTLFKSVDPESGVNGLTYRTGF